MRHFPLKHIEKLNAYVWYARYFAQLYRGEICMNPFIFYPWDVFIISQSNVMQVGINFTKNNKTKCNMNT